MKVVVDFDECASNAVCMGILPEVFEVRDDGFLYVLDEHPPEALREPAPRGGERLPHGRHLHRGRLTERNRPAVLGVACLVAGGFALDTRTVTA